MWKSSKYLLPWRQKNVGLVDGYARWYHCHAKHMQILIPNCLIRYQIYIYFFYNSGCPDQFTRTTTNPRTHWTSCKLSRHVRHRGDDRRTREGSNPRHIGKAKPAKATKQQTSVWYQILLLFRKFGNDGSLKCFFS